MSAVHASASFGHLSCEPMQAQPHRLAVDAARCLHRLVALQHRAYLRNAIGWNLRAHLERLEIIDLRNRVVAPQPIADGAEHARDTALERCMHLRAFDYTLRTLRLRRDDQ